MSVSLDWQTESPCEAKVCKLDRLSVVADEQVLGLEIAVENSIGVQEDERLAKLVEEGLRLLGRQSGAFFLHVLLQRPSWALCWLLC